MFKKIVEHSRKFEIPESSRNFTSFLEISRMSVDIKNFSSLLESLSYRTFEKFLEFSRKFEKVSKHFRKFKKVQKSLSFLNCPEISRIFLKILVNWSDTFSKPTTFNALQLPPWSTIGYLGLLAFVILKNTQYNLTTLCKADNRCNNSAKPAI